MKKCMLIDGSNLISAHLHTYWFKGEITNPEDKTAIWYTLKAIVEMVESMRVQDVVLCADVYKDNRTRCEILPTYKAQREKKPHHSEQRRDLATFCREFLPIISYEKPGYEADDLIAYLADREARDGNEATIISTDGDLLQVAQRHPGRVFVYQHTKKAYFQLPDDAVDLVMMKALTGDTSDNIPSVTGPKTAEKILRGEYKLSLDEYLDEEGKVTRSEKLPRRIVFDRNLELVDLLGEHSMLLPPRRMPELWGERDYCDDRLRDAIEEWFPKVSEVEADKFVSFWRSWMNKRFIDLDGGGSIDWVPGSRRDKVASQV